MISDDDTHFSVMIMKLMIKMMIMTMMMMVGILLGE